MKQKFPNLRRGLTALVLSLLLCAQALAAMPEYLVPGGSTAGIKLYTGGLLITALDEDAPAQRGQFHAWTRLVKTRRISLSKAEMPHAAAGFAAACGKSSREREKPARKNLRLLLIFEK